MNLTRHFWLALIGSIPLACSSGSDDPNFATASNVAKPIIMKGWDSTWSVPSPDVKLPAFRPFDVVESDANTIDYFYVNSDDSTEHAVATPQGTTFENLHGASHTIAAAGWPLTGEKVVVAVSLDLHVMANYKGNSDWSGWVPVGGRVPQDAMYPVVAFPSGVVHIFVVGTDHQIWHRRGLSGGDDAPWDAMPRLPGGRTVGANLRGTLRKDGSTDAWNIDLVVPAQDGTLWHLGCAIDNSDNISKATWDQLPSANYYTVGVLPWIGSGDSSFIVGAPTPSGPKFFESGGDGRYVAFAPPNLPCVSPYYAMSSPGYGNSGVIDLWAEDTSTGTIWRTQNHAWPTMGAGPNVCDGNCGVFAGNRCCGGGSCAVNFLACNAQNVCESCGSVAGELCCARSTCDGNLTCDTTNHCRQPAPPPPPPKPLPPDPPNCGHLAAPNAECCIHEAPCEKGLTCKKENDGKSYCESPPAAGQSACGSGKQPVEVQICTWNPDYGGTFYDGTWCSEADAKAYYGKFCQAPDCSVIVGTCPAPLLRHR